MIGAANVCLHLGQSSAEAEDKKAVNQAIDRGVAYLRKLQKDDGTRGSTTGIGVQTQKDDRGCSFSLRPQPSHFPFELFDPTPQVVDFAESRVQRTEHRKDQAAHADSVPRFRHAFADGQVEGRFHFLNGHG